MKALSVRQPWAWAIVRGIKRVENRSRRTTHRGPLLIHASRSRASIEDAASVIPDVADADSLPFGAIVGVVRLVDVVPVAEIADHPFAIGPWCWMLDDAETFDPIPWPGRLQVFDVPDAVIRRARVRRTRK